MTLVSSRFLFRIQAAITRIYENVERLSSMARLTREGRKQMLAEVMYLAMERDLLYIGRAQWRTVGDIARLARMSRSTYLRDLLFDMVEDGDLLSETLEAPYMRYGVAFLFMFDPYSKHAPAGFAERASGRYWWRSES